MGKTAAHLGPAEAEGATLAREISKYIESKKGQFLRGDGTIHVIVDGKRIPINQRRDNRALNRLVLNACDVSTVSAAARIAIQRLEADADEKAGHLQMRKFSAVSQDRKRLYIPLDDGSLLLVTSGSLLIDKNGENEDGLWIEHPNGSPFGWSDEKTADGLAHFERLLVETQACKEPAMRWLVAMHEGLFPFVRDFCPARLLLVHTGDSQSGKTTGAQRFTLLHGLGDVKGDYSVAALSNIGDIGLLAMDNKEQSNLQSDYINFLLFLSTGAERGRSHKDGRMRTIEAGRPAGVITSIEGLGVKSELRNRLIEVQFAVKGTKLNRGPIEQDIRKHRDSINSTIACVLQWFLIYHEGEGTFPTPNPIPDFQEHFSVLCNLLRAFAFCADKPEEWAQEIIHTWGKLLAERETEEDILEHPLLQVLRKHKAGDTDFETVNDIVHDGKSGTLQITDCGALLAELRTAEGLQRITIPDTSAGLGKRLRSTQFIAFRVLDEERAPAIALLKRTGKRRPIGFFIEDDSGDVCESVPSSARVEVTIRKEIG